MADDVLFSAQEGVAAAGGHLGYTSQPEGVGVPQGESSVYLRVLKHLHLRALYTGALRFAAAVSERSISPYFRNSVRAFPGVGAAATSFTASGAAAYVEATEEQEDVPLRENDDNLSHQIPQYSAGGSRQFAVHSNNFLSNLPFEGVEATEEDVRLRMIDDYFSHRLAQISAVGSQQSAMLVQFSIILGLFSAAVVIFNVNISRPRSDPAAARVLGLVAIIFDIAALLTTASSIIILWVRLRDPVAAAARPAPGHPYRTMTWLFYIGWILWGISIFATLAAYMAAYMV